MYNIKFINVGKNDASFEINSEELSTEVLEAAVQPYLYSSNINFSSAYAGEKGSIFAGFHKVGEFIFTKIK